MAVLAQILVLYGLGVALYYLFRGWLRSSLVALASLLGLLYILIYLVTTAPFKGQNEFDGLGISLLLILASLTGIPALGVLSSALGSKVANKITNKTKSFGLLIAVILALPAFVAFKTITKYHAQSQLIVDYNRSQAAKYDKNMTYAIKLGDEYLNLPCRPELLHQLNSTVCIREHPSKPSDFITLARFTIPSNKENFDDQSICSERGAENSPFCNIAFLPYRISIVTGENEMDLLKKYETNTQEKYRHVNQEYLGGLAILEKIVTNKKNPLSSLRYKFIRENDSSKAHLVCHTQLPTSRQIFGCNVKINFGDKFWVTLILQSKLSEIETELDKKTSEIAAYYEYLMDHYRLDSETLFPK